MTEKNPLRKTREKRPDFGERVTLYGIEGRSIIRCASHPKQLVKSPDGPQGGLDRIDHAWQMGWISSDAGAAKDLYNKIYAALPDTCPKCEQEMCRPE